MVGAFPVKVYEYLSLGKPCVVIPNSEAGSTVVAWEAGFSCDNDQVAEAVNFIKLIAKDKQLYHQTSTNALALGCRFTRYDSAQGFRREVDKIFSSTFR